MFPRIVSLLLCASFCAAAVRKDPAGQEPAEIAVGKKQVGKELAEFSEKRLYTVVDALGSPVSKATVVLSVKQKPPRDGHGASGDETQPAITLATDDQGRVAIPDLSERNVSVSARIHHPDYGTARYEVDLTGRVTILQVPLVRSGTEAHRRALSGQVVASDGKGVGGAVIHCGSVRTPGEGLISAVSPVGDALTDDDGRFTCYLPNVNRDRQRGDLIPLNSRYLLKITGPEGDSFFPVVAYYANREPVRIELPRPTRMHRLRVEAPGGGRVDDPEQLRQIYVQYASEQDGERAFVVLDSMSVFRGRRLPPGKYLAQRVVNGKIFHYRPLVVSADSPAELVFQLPPPVTCFGRVVHGVTGRPMAGAFVMAWNATAHNNLALLTADDWKLLHELPSAPELDEPAILRLRQSYGVQGLVRTNGEGRFEITRQPDQEFYGLMAFDEDFVPYKVRLGSLQPDEKEHIDAGEFPMFPAAKVLIRPVFDGKSLAVSPKWLPAATGQPVWIDRFQAAGKGSDREFEYVHWLKLNELQAVYVPAGVRLHMRLETPYADEWAPARVETLLQLEPRQTLEVGDLHFAASLTVVVRVVDGKGNPVEGAAVRRMYDDGQVWTVAHNTDQDGLAHFHLHPGSTGKFRVTDLPGPREVGLAGNLVTDFDVGQQAPAKRFEFILTDEQLRSLRSDAKSPPRNAP